MKHLLLCVPLALLPLAACSTTVGTVAGPTGDGAPKKEDPTDKREELTRKLELARAQHEVAELEAAAAEADREARLRHAAAELNMARAKLATFQEVDKPNRIAKEELNLQSARDRAQEARDELAQVELMYAEQDLNDMTREFVIQRERRNVARSEKRIRIQEGEFRAFRERELPQEQDKLELAVDKAQSDLQAAQRKADIGRREHEIKVRKAADEVAALERKLAKSADGESESESEGEG